jgi:twitching motility protein PilT
VSAQLFQLLGQLDRPGATELVIATGRQVALRINSAYQPLTAAVVTMPQLLHLIRDTQLAEMVPSSEKTGEPIAIDLDGRSLRAQFIRQGSEVMLRLEHRRTAPAARGSKTTGRTRTPSRSGEPAPARTPIPSRSPTPSRTPMSSRTDAQGATPSRADARETPSPRGADSGSGRIPAARAEPGSGRIPTPRAAEASGRTPVPEASSGRRPSRASTPPHGSAVSVPQVAVRTTSPTPSHAVAVVTSDEPSPRLIDEPSQITPALAALVAEARQRNATDLHIAANRPVLVRAVGELVALDPAPRSAVDVEGLLLPLLGPVRRQQLAERGYVDLAVDVPGAGRLRTNVSRQQGGLKGSFRLSVARPPTLEELGLPAALAKVTEHHQGLVVIAGPSGHGKTTTLAALVDLLNRADPIHILTIEDPVEIVHPRHAAVVSQREVGRHTVSFASALKASLREDPDVIVIGELRDRETVEIALTAAETGHLVLATMSTPSAAKTIDRLIDMFPPDDQSQVRASLGAALKAIVAQRLVPNAQGTGVVAAVELLVGVLALANLIRDNKLFQLPNLMQRGRAFGMLRLDDSLLELVRAGKLAEDVALRHADSRKELLAALHPAAPEPAKRGLFGRRGE